MKRILTLVSLLLTTMVINNAYAAQLIEHDNGKQKIGVVSASDASNLDDLIASLNSKADQQGATSFKVISTSGKNKLNGVADIYR